MWDADLAGGVALVLGAEGKGVRPLVRRTCDATVAIPLAGKVGSLNVCVAAAVLLFEARRQRTEGRWLSRPSTSSTATTCSTRAIFSDRDELVDALASFVAAKGAGSSCSTSASALNSACSGPGRARGSPTDPGAGAARKGYADRLELVAQRLAAASAWPLEYGQRDGGRESATSSTRKRRELSGSDWGLLWRSTPRPYALRKARTASTRRCSCAALASGCAGLEKSRKAAIPPGRKMR